MVEALVNFFRNIIPGELTVFILSMMPIIELRGGLVAAKMLGVDLLPAMLICFIGTYLPTPFISRSLSIRFSTGCATRAL